MSSAMPKAALAGSIGLALVAFALGWGLRGCGSAHRHGGHGDAAVADHDDGRETVWTCSMHPQIRQPRAGKCPICFMDLIPVEDDAGPAGTGAELTLSAASRALASVRTEPVQRRFVSRSVRLAGRVGFDETRLATISARFPGRIERLYIDFTGVRVRAGDHLATIYSPELLSAQQELLNAAKTAAQLKESPSEIIRTSAAATVEAAREKLRLWGLTAEQIAEVEARATPQDTMTLHAPTGGIVVGKEAVEGMYVETGTVIARIADLSRVWVRLDAYETDLTWLRHGQSATLEAQAFPGEAFAGTVAFIDPVLDEATRTVGIRVNVPNPDGRLRPGMFIRGVVESELAAGNRVRSADLEGKYVCPMHPDVVAEGPSTCSACGMDLAPAAALGYAEASGSRFEMPLVVPASAPLITGERAVVYVQSPDDPGRFSGREVVLGPRAGEWQVIQSGLLEGERVVVNGAFKIDSALQILARPSMMSGAVPAARAARQEAEPEDPDQGSPLAVPAAFVRQLQGLFGAYLRAQEALAGDDLDAARAAGAGIPGELEHVDMALVTGTAHQTWMSLSARLRDASTAMAAAGDLPGARRAFEALSRAAISLGRRFGTGLADAVVVVRCPMAFDDRGAAWVQRPGDVANPYYGSDMLRCGEPQGDPLPGTQGGPE